MADCCFANAFEPGRLLSEPAVRRRFFAEFLSGVGHRFRSSVGETSCDSTSNNVRSLNQDGESHWPHLSTPTKQALEIALLALAATRTGLAHALLPTDDALQQLTLKARALGDYRVAFPNRHGYLPHCFNASHISPMEETKRIPRCNALLAWSLYGAVHLLEGSVTDQVSDRDAATKRASAAVSASLRDHLNEMSVWAVPMFYDDGKTNVHPGDRGDDVSEGGKRDGYILRSDETDCGDEPSVRELFDLFLDLLAVWPESAGKLGDERKGLLSKPRCPQHRGTADDLSHVDSSSARRGIAVKAELKYMFLPYTSVPNCMRTAYSAEKIRTAFFNKHGLFSLAKSGSEWLGSQVSGGLASNFPQLAANARYHVNDSALAGIAGLLLMEPAVGSVWLREALCVRSVTSQHSLAAEALSFVASPHLADVAEYDSGESFGAGLGAGYNALGACVSATNAIVAVSVLGGLGQAVSAGLKKDKLLQRFHDIVSTLYADVVLDDELATDFALPAAMLIETADMRRKVGLAEPSEIDLEMLQALRGVELPASDALRLSAVRSWFTACTAADDNCEAPYCSSVEDWWSTTGDDVRFDVKSWNDRDRLYENIVTMFELGAPLALLARQAPLYALFFDIDIYGYRHNVGSEKESENGEDTDAREKGNYQDAKYNTDAATWGTARIDAVTTESACCGGTVGKEVMNLTELMWEGGGLRDLILAVALALLRLYPQFRHGLEIAVFHASGYDRKSNREKVSYHIFFPQIIVDRAVKCWQTNPCVSRDVDAAGKLGCTPSPHPARHVMVREHVLHCLHEDGRSQKLHQDLLSACGWEVIARETSAEGTETTDDSGDTAAQSGETYLNDWCEVFDENPFWHEPWPDAFTGLRLPFTDKQGDTYNQWEGRPKLPLGRWLVREATLEAVEKSQPPQEVEGEVAISIQTHVRELTVERLADLDAVDWVRLGDISVCTAQTAPTPWDEFGLHQGVDHLWDPCPCPSCAEKDGAVDIAEGPNKSYATDDK
eukprot:TRINITY_DN38689_c0_g1_i1.p1 TRINITY_DN38689_c0_g1~~TRINITY_DN38689_c0_g1_i1.p1  ORF type:complete len:1009 (+),score=141.82 TRINITY_DN38689_c0_g1_i1:74-3100(+)